MICYKSSATHDVPDQRSCYSSEDLLHATFRTICYLSYDTSLCTYQNNCLQAMRLLRLLLLSHHTVHSLRPHTPGSSSQPLHCYRIVCFLCEGTMSTLMGSDPKDMGDDIWDDMLTGLYVSYVTTSSVSSPEHSLSDSPSVPQHFCKMSRPYMCTHQLYMCPQCRRNYPSACLHTGARQQQDNKYAQLDP